MPSCIGLDVLANSGSAPGSRPVSCPLLQAGNRRRFAVKKLLPQLLTAESAMALSGRFERFHRKGTSTLLSRAIFTAGDVSFRQYTQSRGLMSYGVDLPDAYGRPGFMSGVLNGTKLSELPVLQPTEFEFVINLKTAKARGLAVPASVLAIADVVIE